jgi:hypothetical protein
LIVIAFASLLFHLSLFVFIMQSAFPAPIYGGGIELLGGEAALATLGWGRIFSLRLRIFLIFQMNPHPRFSNLATLDKKIYPAPASGGRKIS